MLSIGVVNAGRTLLAATAATATRAVETDEVEAPSQAAAVAMTATSAATPIAAVTVTVAKQVAHPEPNQTLQTPNQTNSYKLSRHTVSDLLTSSQAPPNRGAFPLVRPRGFPLYTAWLLFKSIELASVSNKNG